MAKVDTATKMESQERDKAEGRGRRWMTAALAVLGLILVQGWRTRSWQPLGDVLMTKREATGSSTVESLVELVDLLRGVLPNDPSLSRGNVLPILARPRGMAHWVPASSSKLDDLYFVNPALPHFAGIRCTHQPSPWIGDYGQFLLGAKIEGFGGEPMLLLKQAKLRPHVFHGEIANYCAKDGCASIIFSPSEHGGVLRVAFPPGLGARRERSAFLLLQDGAVINADKNGFSGYSVQNSGGIVYKESFKHYFDAQIEMDSSVERININSKGTCSATGNVSSDLQHSSMACETGLTWQVKPPTAAAQIGWDIVVIRIGVSFISPEQAVLNREREVSGKNVSKVALEGASAWNSLLSRVQVSDNNQADPAETLNKMKTLYTHLYRALLFPRDLAEVNAANETVHWSPYDLDGRVKKGPLCTDSGFWDAYRTVYPMLHLVFPDVAQRIMRGWVNALRENGGRTPQWGSPGPRNSMVGTMSDVSLSEAMVNGQLSVQDASDAYASLLLSAYNGTGSESRGKYLDDYIKLGYVPDNVALTLNFKLADYAISRAALSRGDFAVAKDLSARAFNWQGIFDSEETLFFRPKSKDGKFLAPFDIYGWGNTKYTEGGPWQYRFYTPHDPVGLFNAYAARKFHNFSKASLPSLGSKSIMCEALKATMVEIPAVHLDPTYYHEAVELRDCFGQYAHNNQPSHHMLYMFAHAHGDCPLLGQQWIQKARDQLYGEFGYKGDEDNGEMSSWHVLSSLGLYALAPGSGTYQVGAPPLFQTIKIMRPNSPGMGSLEINHAPSVRKRKLVATGENFLVATEVIWNGKVSDLAAPVLVSYKELVKGGALTFA